MPANLLQINRISKIPSVTKSFSTSLQIQNFLSLRDCNNFGKDCEGRKKRLQRQEKMMFFSRITEEENHFQSLKSWAWNHNFVYFTIIFSFTTSNRYWKRDSGFLSHYVT